MRAYGKVSLGEVSAMHETHGLSALMKPCFANFLKPAAGSSGGMRGSQCEASPELFGARLKQAAEYVNLHYDVDALQRELPQAR